MSTTMRQGRCVPAVLLAAVIVACGGGDKKEPPPYAGSGPSPTPAATAEPQGAGTTAWDALTRAKFREEEYRSAITDLENASGAGEAAKDLGAGYRRLLGVPQSSGGWSKLPGVEMPREQIPEGVKLVKILGFVEGAADPHILRYQMLAERYAKDYNGTMIRGIK
jgi:hypothetical protein